MGGSHGRLHAVRAVPNGQYAVVAGARGAMSLEPGHGPAASDRCEVTRHRAGASRGSVFRQPHLVPASQGCSRAASAEPAHGTSGGTRPFLSSDVSPGGTAVTGDDSGIVNAGTRRRREQHRARHPRVRLLEALPGRARQQQVPAGRGLAHLLADVHDPGWRVQLPSNGQGELQPVQSRPAARRRQGLPARPAATPASSR